MFPAIFSVDFQGQGQRSKVTAIKYIGHMTIPKFMADIESKCILAITECNFQMTLTPPFEKSRSFIQNLPKRTQNSQNNYACAMTGMREVEFKTFYMVGILVGFYINV